MQTIALKSVILLGVGLTSGATLADSSSRQVPMFIGDRSTNPEQETYADLAPPESVRLLGFAGPARNVGVVTGDVEEDTIAYLPLILDQR